MKRCKTGSHRVGSVCKRKPSGTLSGPAAKHFIRRWWKPALMVTVGTVGGLMLSSVLMAEGLRERATTPPRHR